jgi:hypothetical protein
MIQKCIRIFAHVNIKDCKIIKCEPVTLPQPQLQQLHIDTIDVIKKGLNTLSHMFEHLKLKTKNDVWFLYVSNGNLQNIRENVGLILLQKLPRGTECFYSINKQSFKILQTMTKPQRLTNLRIFTKSLEEVCTTDKVIKSSISQV